MSDHRPRAWRTIAAVSLVLALNGCGGAGGGTPTALPPDVAHPDQPGLVFDNPAQGFRLSPTPAATRPTPAAPATPVPLPDRATVVAPLAQTPTALAIATAPLVLAAAPNGPGLAELPVGTTLTITGRSADGAWLAGYTNDGRAGWVAAAAVTLFGGADLLVVDHAVAPAAIATLIATAMLPVELPAGLAVAAAPSGPHTGVVLPAEGIAILQSPQAAAPAIGRATAGQALQVLGRSPDGNWLVVVAADALGWAPLTAVQLDAAAVPLRVIQP